MSFLHGSRGATRFGWCVAAAMVLAGCGLSLDGGMLRPRSSNDGGTAGDTLITPDDAGPKPDEGSIDAPSGDAVDVAMTPDAMGGEVVSVDAVEAGDDGVGDAGDEASDVALAGDAADAAEAGTTCTGDTDCPDGGFCLVGVCTYDAGPPSEASVDVPVVMDADDAGPDAADASPDAPDVPDAGPDAPLDAAPMCTAPCPVANGVAPCVMGRCGTNLSCTGLFGDCDHNAANGCEYSTASDPSNCGACGNACPTGQSCVFGACTPTDTCRLMGQRNCGSAAMPMCVDVNSNALHCGTCGNACATGQVCLLGTCACPAGTTTCANGGRTTCTSLVSDESNCGACGAICAGGQTCMAGMCRCPANKLFCGGTCVSVDASHCGSCTTVCPMGFACTGGGAIATAASCTCPSGVVCGGRCVTNSVTCNSDGMSIACPAGSFCGRDGGAPACRSGSTTGPLVEPCMRVPIASP